MGFTQNRKMSQKDRQVVSSAQFKSNGYSHSWDITEKTKAEFSKNVKEISAYIKFVMGFYGSMIESSEANLLQDGVLQFNGVREYAHEDLYFSPDEIGRYFVKTNRKPYDLVVCICLAIIQSFTDISLESDGFSTEEAFIRQRQVSHPKLGSFVSIESGADGSWDGVIAALRALHFECYLKKVGERTIPWDGDKVKIVDVRFIGIPPNRSFLAEKQNPFAFLLRA